MISKALLVLQYTLSSTALTVLRTAGTEGAASDIRLWVPAAWSVAPGPTHPESEEMGEEIPLNKIPKSYLTHIFKNKMNPRSSLPTLPLHLKYITIKTSGICKN